MIAAIIQPYFFPYIGYFQLMHAVDVFVMLDDVQYIDRGWVNRNRIRSRGKSRWLTMPVRKGRRSLWINQRFYATDPNIIDGMEARLYESYSGAPAFDQVFPVIKRILEFKDTNVAAFNANALKVLAAHLGIECEMLLSSTLDKEEGLRKQKKIIAICKSIGADKYINPIGGRSLYTPEFFKSAGIQLGFLETSCTQATLAEGSEHLSIIDELMYLGFGGCTALLSSYRVISPELDSHPI